MIRLSLRLRTCVLCALALMEPCFHALGIPHPEGLSAHAANLMIASGGEE